MADEKGNLHVRGKLLKDLRVKDLREELESRGLAKVGTKPQLLQRLKSQLLLEKLQSQPAPDQLPNVNEGADTDNEFVKQYLEERQRLFEAQKEARRKLEEEQVIGHQAGHMLPSESESQDDESQAEPESPVKDSAQKASVAKSNSRTSARRTGNDTATSKPAPKHSNSSHVVSESEVADDSDYDRKTPEPEIPAVKEKSPETVKEKTPEPVKEKVPEPVREKSSRRRDKTPEPVKEKAPVKEKTPEPVKEKVPEPVKEKSSRRRDKTPEPVKEKAPVKEKTPEPVKEKVPEPVQEKPPRRREKTPEPVKEKTPEPVKEKVPVKEKASEPVKMKTPEVVRDKSSRRRDRSPESKSRQDRKESGDGRLGRSSKSSRSSRHKSPLPEEPARSKHDASSVSDSGDKAPGSLTEAVVKPSKDENRQQGNDNLETGVTEESTSDKEPKVRKPSVEPPTTAPSSVLDIGTEDQDEVLDYDEEMPHEKEERNKIEEIPKMEASPPRKEPTIKPRKISLAKRKSSKSERRSKDRDDAEEGKKKRKWGSSRTRRTSESKTISISTDSLKEVMPELKTTISDANVNSVNGGIPELVELDADSSPERVEAAHVVPEPPPTVPAENVSTPPAVEAVEAVAKEIPRRESIRHEQDQVVVSSDEDDLSDGEIRVVRRPVKPAKIVSLPVEAPVHVRDVSPARNPVACTIHIQFLTRPFTIGQLKELLSKHGPLSDIEGGFWMDKVKSHCYATFQDAKSAEAARKELHGSKWPSSNPKILRVEYASFEQIGTKGGALPGGAGKIQARTESTGFTRRQSESETARVKVASEAEVERLARREKDREEALKAIEKRREERRKENQAPAREWDRHKLRQSNSPVMVERRGSKSERDPARELTGRERSRSRRREERRREREAAAADIIVEKPVSLDDLFRKTTTEPPIYWLPLTDEKIEKNAIAQKKAKEEREKEREREDEQREANRKAYKQKQDEMMKEKQAKADERRRQIEQRHKQERADRDRRRARSMSRSPRRRSRGSRSPVRRRRRSSSSSASSSRSRSRGSPSPKRPARGSPSPKRPVRGSPSPKRPTRGSPSPQRSAKNSPSPKPSRSPKSGSKSPAPSKKRAAKSSSKSPPRKRSKSRSSSSSSSGSGSSSSGSSSDTRSSPVTKKR